MPIHVGKAINESDEKLCMQGDDTGDHISHKNKTYSELTGLYWAWKNLTDVDYIGLCHYRRYFDFRHHLLKRRMYFVGTEVFSKMPCQMPDFERLLSAHDVIIAKPVTHPYRWKTWYLYCGGHSYLDKLTEIMTTFYPEYFDIYIKKINSNKISPYNMFIARSDFFNGYCGWLFSIFNKLENRVDMSSISRQTRPFGYMSERLLEVYIEKHKLRTVRLPILFVNNSTKRNNTIKNYCQKYKNFIWNFLYITKRKYW
jgi:hypothetical protein